jgi:hypothetical protein
VLADDGSKAGEFIGVNRALVEGVKETNEQRRFECSRENLPHEEFGLVALKDAAGFQFVEQ